MRNAYTSNTRTPSQSKAFSSCASNAIVIIKDTALAVSVFVSLMRLTIVAIIVNVLGLHIITNSNDKRARMNPIVLNTL